MKKEQKIWIQGNPKRGDEVIAKLESLCGKNVYNINGSGNYIYFICPNGGISWAINGTMMATFIKDNYQEYKLPEKIPFKPFDKVLIKLYDGIWLASQYSFEDENWFYVTGGTGFSKKDLQVIPFNKDTEHLLGTKDEYTI